MRSRIRAKRDTAVRNFRAIVAASDQKRVFHRAKPSVVFASHLSLSSRWGNLFAQAETAVSYREIEGDGLMSDSTASRIIGLTVLVASATIAMPDASAQTTDKNVGAIPQVIVTAQKREQDLQDVPITVTAVGSQLLRDSGVRDIRTSRCSRPV